jgi:hypothetical protein
MLLTRSVYIDTAEEFNSINIVIIPGKKICPSCRKELSIKLQESNEENQQIADKSNSETGKKVTQKLCLSEAMRKC